MLGSNFVIAAFAASAAVASAHEGHDHSSASVSESVGSSHEEHEHSHTSSSGVSGTVGSTEECSADVSASFIATITNATYFDTCAEGLTFNVTSAFDVLNFTDSEFFAFCNSSTCLEPLHELMGSQDCLIMYEGTARDLSSEVSKLHDQCHEVLDAAGEEMDMGRHSSGSSSSTASGSSDASSLVMTAGSVVSAVVLAAFLA
ncbi:GPI-anchored Elicitin INL11b [Phytophthora megakarya]|uniref:GPI-anchored Elicitin INL11b n=1 Tax=Phytophthora megakarya TaxID=4795 RepID=A0A225VGW6_9STRA|nr:GPI-anchored Elicitin INL11b [Phytophthora megakarya]